VRDRLVDVVDTLAAENGGDRLVESIVGSINENTVTVIATLTDPDIRPMGATELTRLWRNRIGEMAGLESLRFEFDRGGPGSGAALTIELAHRDVDVLDQAGQELAAALGRFSNVKDIDDGFTPGKRQLDFEMLPDGRSLGLTAQDVARQLRSSFYGAEAIRQQRGRNEVRVMVRLPRAQRASAFDIEELTVRTPGGRDVPLRQVAKVTQGRAYTNILRRDGRRTIHVTADVDPSSQTEQVIATLRQDVLPALAAEFPGLSYGFEGHQAEMRDSLGSLKTGFILAMLAIYALLAIPFGSYVQPVIVMMSIPFGIVGAVIGHLLMGYSLSVMSMMGIVALSGVVVNDALVLIVFANRRRAAGVPAVEAVRLAGVRRFRPVILTTLTTFGGLAPMIFETSRQARFMIPMALSLGFGILFATGITLLLVPCLYVMADDVRHLIVPGAPEDRGVREIPGGAVA
jgi:multidrug efflux pump subunit AcrB